MKRFAIVFMFLLLIPAFICAQDVPPTVPTSPAPAVVNPPAPLPVPADTGTLAIINAIGHWVFELAVLLGGFWLKSRVEVAVKQSQDNKVAIDQGKVEDKVAIEHQNTVIDNKLSKQTETLLVAKIAEKPTIPPVT